MRGQKTSDGKNGEKKISNELALLFMQGKEDVFAEIYLKYQWPIYTYIRAYVYDDDDAENLTHDTFVKALKALREKKYVPGENPFSAWLYEIAENIVKNFRRRARNSKPHEPIEEELEEILPGPVITYSDPYLAAILGKALDSLNKTNRYIFIRHVLEEKTFAEIGAELKPKLDEEAVRKRFDRACEKLRPMLGYLRGKY